MKITPARTLLVLCSLFALKTVAFAQTKTIPELLADAKQSLGRSVGFSLGTPPSMESILKETDVIVRGIVGTPRTYLSQNQMDVYSDYPIGNPVFLFPPTAASTSRPGQTNSVTVTHIGGTITIQGLSFSMENKLLPPLEPGTECLFLLKQKDGKYYIAGTYFGVFRTERETFTPLARQATFAKDLRSLRPDNAIQQMLTTIKGISR